VREVVRYPEATIPTLFIPLFFQYLGYIALAGAFDDPARGARSASVLALVGAVNIPIIKFSVDWWNTLHQPASVLRVGGPTIAPSMLAPLLVMWLAFTLLFAALLLLGMRTLLNERKARVLRLNSIEAPEPEPLERAARPAVR